MKTSDSNHQAAQRAARDTRSERGAVGTEMAIIVAIVVAIALAVGAIMTTAANNHAGSIPQQPAGAATN